MKKLTCTRSLKPTTVLFMAAISVGLTACDNNDTVEVTMEPADKPTIGPAPKTTNIIKQKYNVCLDKADASGQVSTAATTGSDLSKIKGQTDCLATALKNCKSAADALECQAAIQAIKAR